MVSNGGVRTTFSVDIWTVINNYFCSSWYRELHIPTPYPPWSQTQQFSSLTFCMIVVHLNGSEIFSLSLLSAFSLVNRLSLFKFFFKWILKRPRAPPNLQRQEYFHREREALFYCLCISQISLCAFIITAEDKDDSLLGRQSLGKGGT